MREIIIDQHETNHQVATIYATVFDNGLVFVQRSVRSKLNPLQVDGLATPEARLTIQQHKFLLAQAAYKWLCSDCMAELTGNDPDMDWPGYHAGTCELCKRKTIIFTTEDN